MLLWQPIYMNAALTNSVMNLCKRLNLIPACTNAHKHCHPLFYVFARVTWHRYTEMRATFHRVMCRHYMSHSAMQLKR